MIEICIENRKELCEYFLDLFKEYNVKLTHDSDNYPFINLLSDNLRISIEISDTFFLYLVELDTTKRLFRTVNYNNSVRFHDEIILFKELILPKYIKQ